MLEKRPLSLRNSDLFLKFKLTNGNKEEKYIENVKSLISKKGPSIGESNHLKSFHALSLLTPLPSSSYFNKTITFSPFSYNVSKSYVKDTTFKKATTFKSNNQNNNQETQDQKLKHKSTQVGDTYPLRYKFQTKLSSISFELNYLRTRESKAGLKEDDQRLSGRPQNIAEGAHPFVQAKELFDSNFKQIKSSSKHQFSQLGAEIVHNSKPEKNNYFSLPNIETKQNNIKLSSVQNVFKLNFYSLYFKSFLYNLNRGVCSGISQKFSIIAINLILFGVITIVQRSYYGKISFAINKKSLTAKLCASKLPNLTMWHEISTNVKPAGMCQNEVGVVKKPKHVFLHPKPKQMAGSFLGQLYLSSYINNDLERTNFGLEKPGLTKAYKGSAFVMPLSAVQKAVQKRSFCKPLAQTLFVRTKAVPLSAPVRFYKALQAPVVNGKQTNFLYQKKGCQFEQVGANNLLFTKLSIILLPHTKVKSWYVDNKTLLSTKHYKKFSFKHKFEVNSNLQENQLFVENKENQIDGSFTLGKKGYVMKPWYYIKSTNFCDNKTIAARSIKQAASHNISYQHPLVPKYQYYIPYNISQQQIIVENDTIPEKRDSINSQIVVKQTKLKSSCLASELVLKRCFYKYGFFFTQFNELDQRTHSNSTVQSERESHFFRVKTLTFLEKQLALKGQQENNQINGSTVNNYIIIAPYKRRTISFFKTDKKKTSAILKSTLPEFLSKNKMSFVSFMPIESRTKEQSFNKKRPLNEVCLANTIAQETKFVFPSFFYKINNLIKYTSTLLVNKNRASDRAKVKALQKRSGTYKAGACTPAFLSSGLTWSRYDLEKLKSINFIQVKDGVSTLNFKPDTLIQNTSVSGYQFSELRKKEIATLFRKIAIFGLPKNTDISLHFQAPASNIIFNGQHQINKKPRLLLTKPCKNEPGRAQTSFVQPAGLFARLTKAYKGSAFVRSSLSQAACKKPHFIFASPDLPSVDLDFLSKSLVEPKMQYTQINLDEVESVKELFEQIGRDYEDYIRQPKDSLPALIISPSLEEDREIEEEGIRIFRKRDLLKRKNLNGALTSNSKDRTFIDDFSIVKSQDGEKQNHQTLVKNALQQAQEEIDDIAKKEEKSGEKDKQVIPPLTRLEALYTIRQREKKYEQAKNLRKDKGNTQIKFSFTNKSLAEKGSAFVRKSEGLTKAEPLYAFVGSGFEQLFLYSDKLNTNFFSDFQVVDIHAPQLFSRLGDEKGSKTGQSTILLSKINKNKGLAKTAFLRAKPCKNEVFARLPKAYKGSAFVMPLYAQTKFVQSSDRKHSFFGEMSLPAHKLTAKKQKQVFEQKGNPLVKLNTKNTELKKSKVKFLDVQAEALQKQHFCTQNKPIFLSFHSTVVTIPFTLLSSLSISSKTHNKKLQSSKFKVGTVKTHIVPPLAWQFEDATTFQPHVQAKTKQGLQSLAKTNRGPRRGFLHGVHKQSGASGLNKNMDWEIKPNLFNWMRGPNRIYFYDNLSQNKGCQGSTPKIKGTPLGSPVYHRVWQAKRIEPSSFRVLQRGQNTPVVPKISQNDWKNIIGWQLKKHFFEEDKRLWSLDNTNKKFKIKKVNLYLPWICITKASDSNTFAQAEGLPLTRSQLQKRCFGTRACKVHASGFSNSDIQLNCQTTRYWRLPTKRNLLSINPPKKRQTYRRKQSSTLLIPTQYIIQKLLGKQNRLSLQSKKTKQNKVRGKNKVFTSPQFQKGVVQKGFKESFLFESVTGYSWLFIYAFVSVLMFKQLFKLVYQAGLKDFFIKFLNSDFGRTITSEEFRYSIQNIPLKEFYTPKKRLQEFFSIDQNKVQLLEIVWFLRNHCQGRHGPRGVLLVGPPGVENVSVVQAIAGEAKVPIIVQSLEKIAQDNEPQRQLEQLYIRAHKHAPCVLFLDQLDTIGARRDQLFKDKLGYAQTKAVQEQGSCKPLAKAGVRTHSLYQKDKINLTSAEIWAQQTGTSNKLSDINTSSKKQNLAILKNKLNVVLRLLTILDGITQSSGVVTVATARDITKLDPALLRPKRFDRRIYLSLPNRQDRIQLFKIQTRNIGHIKEMPWDYLSLQTENMSTADIQSAINYSLFKAVLKKSVHTVETLEYGINCVKTLTEKRVTVM